MTQNLRLEEFISQQKAHSVEFAQDFESGYAAFKLGAMLRQAREEHGLTQQELAERMGTKKPAISRLENHTGDVRLSTLLKVAEALDLQLVIQLQPNGSEPAEEEYATGTVLPSQVAEPAIEGT